MLSGLLALLLLLIVLLAMPLSLTFRLSWPQTTEGELQLDWAFGLVRLQLPGSPSKTPSAPVELPAGKSERSGPRSRNKSHLMAALRQPSFRRRIIRFIRDCWSAFHKRDLQMHLRIGLGDPADTGQLWALMGPVAGVLANCKGASFEIEPEFYEETFELDSSGRIEFVPLQILYLTIAMLLSPPVWRGIKEMRRVA